ncbi:ABC transporter permease subunit [candidate division KSB3 bacterium]|uniref:ABC transporter permease subunit n=1 Tax=candidate division KSB3 bacterium TaxID=2044937 RepID=A0A9D5Q711_9BACT|nr:ABC transporter permease subunit [candidate division KSB3 bacterium]MBD3325812.1 ABC transporter permease subunit [candidate division KSB3 bacterium]
MKRAIKFILVVLVLCYTLLPIYWIVITSLKPPIEYTTKTPRLIPKQVTLSHYYTVLVEQHFSRYLLNTVTIAVSAVLISLIVAFLASYALARYRFPHQFDRVFLIWALLVKMVPPIALAIPLYGLLKTAGLINTKFGVILVYQIYTLPYCIWMLLGFIRDVPLALEEAASIDGASPFRILRSVVLPLVAPGLVATAIFSMIMAWNEFIYALLFLRTPDAFTLPIHIANYITEYETLWGPLMSIGLLSSLPVLILSGFLQKRLVQGFSMTLK